MLHDLHILGIFTYNLAIFNALAKNCSLYTSLILKQSTPENVFYLARRRFGLNQHTIAKIRIFKYIDNFTSKN